MYQVILVDDEPWALAGLEDIIDWTAEGFEICGRCTNAAEALKLLEQCDADAVFTDIRMSKMSGLELVSAVKQQKPGAECVIISAYSDFEVARKAILYRAAGYIVKPLEKGEVLEMVRQVKARLDMQDKGPPVINLEDEKSIEYTVSHLDRISRGRRCCVCISSLPLRTAGEGITEIKIRHYLLYTYFCSSDKPRLPLKPDHTGGSEGGTFASSPWHNDSRELQMMLEEAVAAGNGQFSYTDHAMVSQIQFYIAVHYAGDLSLAHIAEQFLLSENYLCELFKKHTGNTVINFLKKVRLKNSLRLLKYSDRNIKEVYEQVGFRDYSYFDRSFKKLFGITPDQFRNEKGNGIKGGICADFDLPPQWRNHKPKVSLK